MKKSRNSAPLANRSTVSPSRTAATSLTRSPSSPRTCASSPHSGGGCAPGGGAGANGFMVANIRPMKPSGVQLSRPIRPPGRTTRTSSSAASWWRGANITPTHEIAASNSPSSYGSACGVVGAPVQVEALGLGGAARPMSSSARRDVGGDDVGAGAGGGQRGVAGAGRDVEDVLAGADAGSLDEPGSERGDDLGGHGVVVAESPERSGV